MAIEFSLLPPINNKVLLAPDISKILELAAGNVGIADNIKKASLITNLATINNVEALKIFLKNSKVSLPNDIDTYIKDGRLRIPTEDIKFEQSEDKNGFKALEITTIKSIFETQKPYMEIIAIMTKNLVGVEDLIARILALSESSLKPIVNPKALGYQYGSMKSDINTLQNFNDKSKQEKGTKNTNYFDRDFSANPLPNSQANGSKTYQILGTEYSTGEFDPTVNYEYIYHDIEESTVISDSQRVEDVDKVDKPEVISFGLYNTDGIQIEVPEWLLNSGKWYGQFPQVGSFQYIWKRDDNTVNSLGVPDPEIYGTGWENTEVKVFNQSDIIFYQEYYRNLVDIKLSKRAKINEQDKQDIRQKVNSRLDIPAQLNAVSNDGFINDFEPALFKKNNASLIPKQISFSGSNIYVDAESDYDLKFIKIDSTLDINYLQNIDKEVSTRIQRFLLNTYTLSFDDNALFDANFTSNDFTLDPGLIGSNLTLNDTNLIGVNNILMDNLTNDFTYALNITRRVNPSYFKPIFWKENNRDGFTLNSPSFGLNTQEKSANFHYIFLERETNKWRYNIYNAISEPITTTSSISSTSSTTASTITGYKFNPIINTTPIGAPVGNGNYEVPNNFGTIIVMDGYIYGWKLNPINFSISNLQSKIGLIDSNTLLLNENIQPLEAGSIRVNSDDNRFGKIINKSQITNRQLRINAPYSDQEYGNTQIQQLFRYRTSIDDTETFYILEGKLKVDEQQNLNDPNQNQNANNNPSRKYYKKPDSLGAAKKFVDVFISILVDLVPAINQLLALIKNPTSFITEILKTKLGENFEMFNPSIISKFQSLASMSPQDRAAFVEKNLDLKKYIFVNNLGEYLHVLDGQALINFLDIRFGLELKKLKISLIFETLKQFSDGNSQSGTSSGIGDADDNLGGTPSTEIRTTTGPNGETITEEISVVYSTGKKIDSVNYKYIYLTERVVNLIARSDNLVKAGDLENAMNPLVEAYNLDPKNDFIRQRLENLRKLINSSIQPILDFLLNLVTMPIKMVLEIINYIKNIFENITVATVADTFKDFITFNWIKQFTSKDFILGLLGMKIDFAKLKDWKKNWKTYPDDFVFDLSEIFSAPFFFQLPKMPKNAIQYVFKSLCETINSVLSIIEGLINAVIDLIWSLISLDAIIPQPYVKLTQPCSNVLASEIDVDKLFNLLNGGNTSGLDDFAFNVITSDGRNLRDLNREELEEFIKGNQNYDFKFDF